MAFAKFQENRFRIDGEIAENHAILVNLTAGITLCIQSPKYRPKQDFVLDQTYIINLITNRHYSFLIIFII